MLGIVQQAFQIASRELYRGLKPIRDPAYLRFVRMLCCVVCGSYRHIEAAHFGGHGIGQKASDVDTLPLCLRCHRLGPHSYHNLGAKRFVEFHGLDVMAHQERLREFYTQKLKGKVA